jgi:hypothetical protein
VADAAVDGPVLILAREFLGIGTGVQVWCTIGITFEGNGGHGDDWTCGKALLEHVLEALRAARSTPIVYSENPAG